MLALSILIIIACSLSSCLAVVCKPDGEGSWSIGLVYGKDPFNLRSPSLSHNDSFPCIRNPIVSCSSVTDVVATFVADPFLYIPKSNPKNWYLFYEVKNDDKKLQRGKGQIGCSVSKNQGQTWEYLQVAFRLDPKLNKWQHLSYPFMFEYNNEHYMLPQQWGSLTLYKAKEFPLQWEKHSVISPIGYIDPNLIFYDDQWWLIAMMSFTNAHYLHVLYSKEPNNPLGPYIDTPNNCQSTYVTPNKNAVASLDAISNSTTCIGGHGAVPHKHVYTAKAYQHIVGVRPGGSVFIYNSKLYRFVQNSEKSYGDSLDLYEITVLSKVNPLQEHLIPSFRSQFRHPTSGSVGLWNTARYHHLDVHYIPNDSDKPGGYWVGVTDGDSQVDQGGAETIESQMLKKQLTVYTETVQQNDAFQTKCAHIIAAATTNAVTPPAVAVVVDSKPVSSVVVKRAPPYVPLTVPSGGFNYHELFQQHQQKSTAARSKELCFFTGLSANHYPEYLRALEGIFLHYPCNKIYIYDLGLTPEQIAYLTNTVPMITILPLVTKRPYFEYKACVFKPSAILHTIDSYGVTHGCSDFFYLDSSIRFHLPFDQNAFNEVDRIGVLAEAQSVLYAQIEFTHPGMYTWFKVDREKDYEQFKLYTNTTEAGERMMQIQAGLMMVNVFNRTIRESLFVPWQACADQNTECLSPGGFKTHWASEKPRDDFMVYGTEKVFRAHRDDQSAFTFLMDRNFGHGSHTIRGPTYLNKYVYPGWHTRSNEGRISNLAGKLQC